MSHLHNRLEYTTPIGEDQNICVNVEAPLDCCCCCCCDDPEIDILFELYALVATLPKAVPKVYTITIDCEITVKTDYDHWWDIIVRVEEIPHSKEILCEMIEKELKAWPAYIPIRVSIKPISFYAPLFLNEVKLRGYINRDIIRGEFEVYRTQFYAPLFLNEVKLRGYINRTILAGAFTYAGIVYNSFSSRIGAIQYTYTSINPISYWVFPELASTVCFPFGRRADITEHIQFDRREGYSWVLSSGGISNNNTPSEYNWFNESPIGMYMLCTPYSDQAIHVYELSSHDAAYLAFEAIISFDLTDSNIYHPSSNARRYYFPLICPVQTYKDTYRMVGGFYYSTFFTTPAGTSGGYEIDDWKDNGTDNYWSYLYSLEMGNARFSAAYAVAPTTDDSSACKLYTHNNINISYEPISVSIDSITRTNRPRLNIFYSTNDRYPIKITVDSQSLINSTDYHRNYVVVDGRTGKRKISGNRFLNQWEAIAKFVDPSRTVLGRGHSWSQIRDAIIALINELNS